MASSVETFDRRSLRPLRSRSLGPGRGSLTWLDWHAGSWWACFANYQGKGGELGRDHKWTTLVRYSQDFTEQGAWLFPEEVVERMAPRSSSGGAWNRDGLLYVTGHDRPELYAIRLPQAGSRLELVAIVPTVTGGQAVDWDADDPRLLWSIDRQSLEIVASRIPPIDTPSTVRKISFGEGVERVFPLYSPAIDSIEVVRRGAVRRAKLYYLRGRTGKSARIAERRDPRRETAKADKAGKTEKAGS